MSTATTKHQTTRQDVPLAQLPTCPDCSNTLPWRTLTVSTVLCWNCRNELRIATGQQQGHDIIPDYFTQVELEFAKQNGVTLERRYSYVAKGKYLANVCTSCDQIQGNYYLYTFAIENRNPEPPTLTITQDSQPPTKYHIPAHLLLSRRGIVRWTQELGQVAK